MVPHVDRAVCDGRDSSTAPSGPVHSATTMGGSAPALSVLKEHDDDDEIVAA